MHLSVQFNHFNRAHWVAVRCEASGVSEATPTVAEASEASGSYLYIYIHRKTQDVSIATDSVVQYSERHLESPRLVVTLM